MANRDIATTLGKADEAFVDEILREAEARLSAQLEVAVAADQRAMTFLGFLLTLVVFLIGGALAAFTAETPSVSIALIAAIGAVGFVAASYFAYQASKPVNFEFVGNDPSGWVGDVEEGKTLLAAKAEQCAHYDEMLKDNRAAMSRSSEALQRSSAIAAITVGVCGLLAFAKLLLGF